MESLGDILRRVTARNISRTTNGDSAKFETSKPSVDPCPQCKGFGWITKRVPLGHPDFGEAFPCECQATAEPAARVASLRRYSNLGPLSRMTFAATQPEGPLPDAGSRTLFGQALEAAVRFAEEPQGWLTFAGPSGSGKTHLAVAVANRCIERGQPTFFIVAADLLDHLRAAYSPDNPVSYDELFDQVRNVPVLVLDDLSTQTATPWAQEKLFQVFNHRFNAALPTVVTVRGQLQRLDESLRTRLEPPPGLFADVSEVSSRVFQLGRFNSRLARRIGDLSEEMQKRMTFASFDTNGNQNASQKDRDILAFAKEAAEAFASSPEGWLLLTGQRGCGKTHLAVAIGGESLRQGRDVFFAFVPSLLDHLRATFSPDSPIGYDELFEQVKTVPLLILDDLGAESSTVWAKEKLYQIVVERHEARLPTVITSAFDLDELEEAEPRVGSRLMDTNVVNWVPISAGNYRDQRRV
ncbi:MAG: ATP-binding protein [Chloroflexi bacterium]|nr:ATP-binding protein [Chloroflexota bacterium]